MFRAAALSAQRSAPRQDLAMAERWLAPNQGYDN